MKLLNKFQMNK